MKKKNNLYIKKTKKNPKKQREERWNPSKAWRYGSETATKKKDKKKKTKKKRLASFGSLFRFPPCPCPAAAPLPGAWHSAAPCAPGAPEAIREERRPWGCCEQRGGGGRAASPLPPLSRRWSLRRAAEESFFFLPCVRLLFFV